MMLLVWNSKQRHAVLLSLGAVHLGGTPTGARAGHYVQIAFSLPGENRTDHLQLQFDETMERGRSPQFNPLSAPPGWPVILARSDPCSFIDLPFQSCDCAAQGVEHVFLRLRRKLGD